MKIMFLADRTLAFNPIAHFNNGSFGDFMMNVSFPFSLKMALSTSLVVTLLGATVGCTVVSPDYDNQSIYRGDNSSKNTNYERVGQELHQTLRRQGYQVMDISAATYRGERVLVAKAKKNNQAYEFTYSYPNLKLLNSSKQKWSKVWNDKDYKKDTGKYSNDRYNNGKRDKNENIEDQIKNQKRYSAIRQQAIRKVTSMGYRVKDIELDEKSNRGVFEIEARKGSQDYEILLSYPNLNVLKIEKD